MLTIISASGWPIWPLLFISVLGLAILIERTWFLRKNRIAPKHSLDLALMMAAGIQSGQVLPNSELEQLSQESRLGTILASGLRALSLEEGQLQVLEAMREAAAYPIKELGKYLNTLATIATLAPLMGLFGTVLGMIEIFASQGGSATPNQLAQGISMALYNTAFGLLIAIPAIAGWRFLREMANNRQEELNEATRLFIKANFPS